jgi:predicted RNA-binding Zn ribbon-like protein
MSFEFKAGELCLDFINTLDNRPVPERLKELINSYADLADWATESGAIHPKLRASLIQEAKLHPARASAVLRRAIDFRETLYRIVESSLAKRDPAEADRGAFSSVHGEALSHLELRATRQGLKLDWPEDQANLEAVLWPIARSAGQLLTSADMRRVRECGSETCRWLFVDRSKNGSRRWCDMKVCGNRTKAQKFYRRNKAHSKPLKSHSHAHPHSHPH